MKSIVIVGAGMAGVAAAIALSRSGRRVIVVEKEAAPGGKMRQVSAGGEFFDAGPTVLTMKWVFDALLAPLETDLASEVRLSKSKVLARHYWSGGDCLDLYADIETSAAAIREFADGKNAEGYLRFCRDSSAIYGTLRETYISNSRPGPFELTRRIGFSNPGRLFGMRPFSTMWSALGDYFPDERLRQLFGRYATYCGSSPFQAPATLMLVASVEQAGVWQVQGGMHALATALAEVAERNGVEFRYNTRIEEITSSGGKVSGIVTAHEIIAADHVIFNGDVSALATMSGQNARIKPVKPPDRSLSAMVVCGVAKSTGNGLAHHTVCFGDEYRAEFEAIFKRRETPGDPTVYLCAQDRSDDGNLMRSKSGEGERMYLLMNLPANGDMKKWSRDDLARCLEASLARLDKSGIQLAFDRDDIHITGPEDFDRLFPGTGGALYGRASHGWAASFRRHGSRTAIEGLYLAGGSVHPGPGVPMAALSGKLAAEEVLSDLAST